MKNILLCLFICFSSILCAQTSIVDFEDNGGGVPDCNATPEWPNDPNPPVVTLVANPNTSGVNTTPNCVKFEETSGSSAGNSLQFAFSGSTATTGHDLVANKFVKIMVYSEDQTNFDVLLELGTGGTPHFAMTRSVATTLNTWTEVEFDFTGSDPDATINNPTGWITNIRIHFNDGTGGQGDAYYVDEYYITPTSTVTPPTPTTLVDFEDNGVGAPDCIPNPEWLGDPNAPVVTEVANPNPSGINNSVNAVKFEETTNSSPGNSLQWAFDGTTVTTGHDLVANKYVNFMVYSENQTNFDILLELGTGGTPHFSMTKNVTTALYTWTQVEFDFTGNDPNAMINNPSGWISNIRIHFNEGTAGQGDIYYVDQYDITAATIYGPFTPPAVLPVHSPIATTHDVTSPLQLLEVELTTAGPYANFTLYSGTDILVDNIDVPSAGTCDLNFLIEFPQTGVIPLTLVATGSDITVESFMLSDYSGGIYYPGFTNVTTSAGIVDQSSLKYGGPSIADINDDGFYDLVLNNHNDSPSKLYWNDGDGTFTKQTPDLALWNLMDLHGSAAGDYDNDGDMDLLIAVGGGNGTNPTLPVLYRNDNGTLIRVDASVGITSGARGRSPRWTDMDLDGDLDLALINAEGINNPAGAQHLFYENLGDGTFQAIAIADLEAINGERILLTDLNNDHIDDMLIFSPLSVWKGNGDFTFTDMSGTWLPGSLNGAYGIMGAADVDIDNDGDVDLYLAKGEGYFSVAENNSADFYPLASKLDMRISGSQGVLPFEVNAGGSITISELEFLTRNAYAGGFPLYLGSASQQQVISYTDTLVITQAMANGWPASRTNNGLYIGYIGNSVWKVESVRNADIFWSIHFTLDGVNGFTPTGWTPNNRNAQDVLLENTGSSFVDVSSAWNIPKGGNSWGVTTGDFNNDSYEDLYVYRFGYLKNRLADYMLLNTGSGTFDITTTHAASNTGSSNHGDMGQAFDHDLDGNVDILNGDDEYGVWHLYENAGGSGNNYVLVDVGYSPNANVDPIAAEVTIVTPNNTYHKRIGSAGEVFSQSLLDIVHFGLGPESQIDEITIRWRNGETHTILDETANQVINVTTALPVELLSFIGFETEKGNQLEWMTASELNNDRFEIQRSPNGNVFEKIGEVKGQGETLKISNYSFLDENPIVGTNYYRLKQIDFDGKFEFSKTIAIDFNKDDKQIGEFYPNPSQSGKVNLDYQSSGNENINIAVYDIAGELVISQVVSVSEGDHNLNFDFSILGGGVYIVSFGDSADAIYRKLVIE